MKKEKHTLTVPKSEQKIDELDKALISLLIGMCASLALFALTVIFVTF